LSLDPLLHSVLKFVGWILVEFELPYCLANLAANRQDGHPRVMPINFGALYRLLTVIDKNKQAAQVSCAQAYRLHYSRFSADLDRGVIAINVGPKNDSRVGARNSARKDWQWAHERITHQYSERRTTIFYLE
jgi:hypothetical protein